MSLLKQASPDHPIHELFVKRWSPYAFSDQPVPEEDLRALFVATRKDPEEFERLRRTPPERGDVQSKLDMPRTNLELTQTQTDELQGEPKFLGVRHVGLLAKDAAGLALFYPEVIGMTVVRQTPADHRFGATTFLARHPKEEDHDVVLVPKASMAHTAFSVASLADLLAFYRRLKERGIPIKQWLNHMVELAVYFEDPEKNLIEVYWVTGLPTPDAYAEPINFELPEAQLHWEVEH